MSNPIYEHPGVSVSPPGRHRWRLRWREHGEDGTAHARSWTVVVRDEQQAHRLATEVSEHLELHGHFEGGKHAVIRARLARLATLFADFIRWRTEIARKAPSTVDYERRATTMFLRGAEKYLQTSRIDVSVLEPDLFAQICAVAFAHLSPSTFDLYARRVFAAWCWATDASTPYSGLRPAPRNASRCITARAVSTIAPDMPSWADLDRCVAMLRVGSRSWLIIQVLRYTGLRMAQARGLRVGDFDANRHALWVSTGKTNAERAGRRIPVAPPLAEILVNATRGRDCDELLAKVTKTSVNIALCRVFAKGELPPEVWSHVPGRGCKRLSHGFRAAFQAELRRRGVSDPVLDVLVGHLGGTVRYRHYVRPSWGELTAAVGLIPRVGYAPAVR